MRVSQVNCHEENIGTIWETSHQCYIMRKFIHKKVTAGRRFDFFWTLRIILCLMMLPSLETNMKHNRGIG